MKIAGILYVQAVRRLYGLSWISARPTNLYGPGDSFSPSRSHVLPGLIRRYEEPVDGVLGQDAAIAHFESVLTGPSSLGRVSVPNRRWGRGATRTLLCVGRCEPPTGQSSRGVPIAAARRERSVRLDRRRGLKGRPVPTDPVADGLWLPLVSKQQVDWMTRNGRMGAVRWRMWRSTRAWMTGTQ